MSRFECDDDYDAALANLWQANIERAMKGKRGQSVLQELHDALLAMPEKRLVEGAIIHEGEVCALGALARERARQGRLKLKKKVRQEDGSYRKEIAVLDEAALEDEFGGDNQDDWNTMLLGRQMGLRETLAWKIAYENDEGNGWQSETPEQRYARVLRWVESAVKEAATP